MGCSAFFWLLSTLDEALHFSAKIHRAGGLLNPAAHCRVDVGSSPSGDHQSLLTLEYSSQGGPLPSPKTDLAFVSKNLWNGALGLSFDHHIQIHETSFELLSQQAAHGALACAHKPDQREMGSPLG